MGNCDIPSPSEAVADPLCLNIHSLVVFSWVMVSSSP